MPATPWRLYNVGVTARMGVPIILKRLAEVTHGKYNEAEFPNVTIKTKDGSISAFKTGSVNVTGCKTEEIGRNLMYQFVYQVLHNKLGMYDARVLNFKRNMLVVKYTTGYRLDLDKLATIDTYRVDYTPQSFQGLHLFYPDPKCVAVIYDTGTVMLTGLKTLEDAQRVYISLDLRPYKLRQNIIESPVSS